MGSLSPVEIEPTSTELSSEVERFCTQEGLLRHLSVALDLIRRRFPCHQQPSLETQQDPETGEEWVVIDITVRADAADFLERYDKHSDELVAHIPWPQRDKIRLAYRLI